MKVILAEKPSVARDIASFLGCRQKHDGYYEGRGCQVTWALGHLVTLKEPGDYDPAWKPWRLNALPIVPSEFGLKVIDDKRSRQQFAIVKRLFKAAEELICATDAGREGELIFRYIQRLVGCLKKPFRRLWLSSLTPDALRKGFAALKPGHDYDPLYHAARCRSEADWIVGMNATRFLTVAHGHGLVLWSAGRIQTPVLAMIVERDDQIRHFKPEPFWEVLTEYRNVDFNCKGDRFKTEQDARNLVDRITGHPFTITDVKAKKERQLPPQLYDLTELQRDMNRRYGFSAAQTLQVAQKLYEEKSITYPRTDSRYLTSDMKPRVLEILRALTPLKSAEIKQLDLNKLPFNARIVDDKKVTDHHAIIPTGQMPNRRDGQAWLVFEAILTRLIAAFYPPCLRNVTTVEGETNQVLFQARGVTILDPGWTVLYPKKKKPAKPDTTAKEAAPADMAGEEDEADAVTSNKDAAEKDEEKELPPFIRGESGPHRPHIKQGETKPPRSYTENTLLSAMETAGKQVDEEHLRQALKERGLGTPATRAATIETLLQRKYIVRRKKTLNATDAGRFLIALIRSHALKSAEMTGEWEYKLNQIRNSALAPETFMKEIASYADTLVHEHCGTSVRRDVWGWCPLCGAQAIRGKKGYGCSRWNEGCPFVLWPDYKDLVLSEQDIRRLLQSRALERPVRIEQKNVYLALDDRGQLLELDQDQLGNRPDNRKSGGKTSGRSRAERSTKPAHGAGQGSEPPGEEPENPQDKSGRKAAEGKREAKRKAPDLGTCPLCNAPVVETEKAFGCSAWRQGCGFVIWKTVAGKKISASTVSALMKKGRSRPLKGFKSKNGKSFDAALKLENGKVVFDFEG